MNTNSENPKVGRMFEEKVKHVAESIFAVPFSEKSVDIGNPARPHKFDLVSMDESIIIECKCYTWTDGGNVPSAKLATLDEAVLYMRSISHPARKIIALKYSKNEKRNQTLAEYFCQKRGNLLEDISVWEIGDDDEPRIIRDCN